MIFVCFFIILRQINIFLENWFLFRWKKLLILYFYHLYVQNLHLFFDLSSLSARRFDCNVENWFFVFTPNGHNVSVYFYIFYVKFWIIIVILFIYVFIDIKICAMIIKIRSILLWSLVKVWYRLCNLVQFIALFYL